MKISLHRLRPLPGLLVLAMLAFDAGAQEIVRLQNVHSYAAALPSVVQHLPNRKSLVNVLDEIESEYGVRFHYNHSLVTGLVVEGARFDRNEDALVDVLDRLLTPLDLEYHRISEKIYVVKGRKEGKTPKEIKRDRRWLKDLDTRIEVGGAIGQRIAGASRAQVSQERSVTGSVTSDQGEKLPGVSVILKGTTVGTVTDVDGKYTIAIPGEDAVLVFSYVGYTTREVSVEGRSVIDVLLEQDVTALEEVVVVGYGTQKKSHLTAAVDQVDAKVLQNRPMRSVADGLQGMVAGLNIRNPSGAPEATPRLNIRGFTGFNASEQPLILVDGVERQLYDINPNDIETISILKDGAASAIYGSRAPYGIVLITTRSGKKGEKMRIGYSANLGYGKPYGLPEQLDSYVWAEYINEAYRNQPGGGGAPFFSDLQVQRMKAYAAGDYDNPVFDGLDPAHVPYGTFAANPTQWGAHTDNFANTMWFDEAMRDVSTSQQHNINVSGGGEKATYYVGLGYNEANGIFKGPNFKNRYSALMKVDTDITDWLTLSFSTNYVRTDERGPNSQGAGREYGTIFNQFARAFPIWSTYNPNGTYYRFNSLPNWNGEAGTESMKMNRVLLSGGFDIEPLKDFHLVGKYTLRNSASTYDRTTLQIFQELPNGTTAVTQRTAGNTGIVKRYDDELYHTIDLHVSYSKTLNNLHSFYVLAGYQEEENRFTELESSATNFFSPGVPAISTASANFQTSDQIIDWATRGMFGRFSYNYAEKYFVEFNVRRDATSRFKKEDRWGTFPSVSGAWNIARENFWPLSETITLLKPRASWTTSGNANVNGYYPFYPSINISMSNNIILGGQLVSTASIPALVSDQLTWAKPVTINIGFDAQAIKDKLELNYDWYQRTVENQFGPPPSVPETIGATVPNANNAVSETRGWEVNVKWNDKAFDLLGKPFRYSVQFRMSDYVGYVVEYEDDGTGAVANQWTPGQVFGQNFQYVSNGIMQGVEDLYANVPQGTTWYYPGDLAMVDINGDGEINSGTTGTWYSRGDLVRNGFDYPRRTYGLTLGVEWNNIDISVLLDGVGHWKRYATHMYVWGTSGTEFFAPFFREHAELGYWRPDNTDAFFPMNVFDGKNRNRANNQYTLDLSHLRVRNVRIGYSVPQSVLQRIGLSRAYLYSSVENMGFIYYNSFIKYDPELLAAANGEGYPPMQYYSFGLNIEL